jgi:hypothetical protein
LESASLKVATKPFVVLPDDEGLLPVALSAASATFAVNATDPVFAELSVSVIVTLTAKDPSSP